MIKSSPSETILDPPLYSPIIRPYTIQSCVFVLLQNHRTLYIKYVEGQWRSWSNKLKSLRGCEGRFGHVSENVHFITTRDKWSHCNLSRLYVSCFSIFYFQACVRTFCTICTTFTSCVNSCGYSYVEDGVGIMLGSWESAVDSHFTAPPLYRFVMLTRIFYTSITCQMEIKNNCFYTLHCKVYTSVNTATCI